VLGAGGNCRDIVDAMCEMNRQSGGTIYHPAGYLDDDPAKHGQRLGCAEVLGPLSSAASHPNCWFVNGLNGTKLTRRKKELLAATGIPRERFITIVHPAASVSRMARLGVGSVILQNASICSEAVIGDHAMVLPNSVVSHDAIVGDYSYVTPGVVLAGYVKLEEAVYMGARSAVMCRVTIGARAVVGMGSVVLEDVPADSVVAGSPARRIK
ncbi:MAG: NeuD/PglB/VioB family sugar acetyltransferase, partial [Chthoniobacterales bacterium]